MAQAKYLFLKHGIYYFRRRISGYQHKTRPVMVSLGSKDTTQALYLVQQLQAEYQKMLNSFIFMHPPLPEELVLSYMTTRLRGFIQDMQRNMRMARMSGRMSDNYAGNLEIHKSVLRAMLTHGMQKSFPAKAIHPDWTKETLETAMRIYDREFHALMSPTGRDALEVEFIQTTGSDAKVLNSREHQYQILEAYLQAKLAAFDSAQDTSEARQDALRKQAEAFVQMGTPATLPDNAPAPIAPRAKPASCSRPPVIPQEAHANLTIRTLGQMHAIAQEARYDGKAGYSSDIASIHWRVVETENLSDAVAAQRASDLRLFSLVTGVLDVTAVKQFHLSQYRDALTGVPKNFLRSVNDMDFTIQSLMARSALNAPADNRLASITMRRHFKSLKLMLKRAKSEGHEFAEILDVTLLNPKTKANTPAHKRHAVFRFDELQNLFGHSAWQGCQSAGRRHASGHEVIKDSRFWVPLILSYTGARRAEISGLLDNDVERIDGIPCFHIRSNAYRGIKGEAGEVEKSRIIPVHPHLIELGLLDHAIPKPSSPTGLLFPDILPQARSNPRDSQPAKAVKIGEALDDFWRKSLCITLDGNPRKLCMHSLRHYVNHQMIHSPDVHEVTRFDLLGHVESGDAALSINTSTYRDETHVAQKHAAIASLRRVF